MRDTASRTGPWPELSTPGWQDAARTLLLWSQLVGKTRLAFAPPLNHWWHVTLYVTARGLGTSAIPHDGGAFEVDFDFVDHELRVHTSSGASVSLPLESGPLADFYERYVGALRQLGIDLALDPTAVEIPEAIRLDRDRAPRRYDRDWTERLFGALLSANRVLQRFRGGFLGKASPVHFFWGASDLATTRFSGRRAPAHPGGVPHCPDRVMLEAYSHEVSSAGFWPGDPRFPEAAFYSYAYPEPPGFADTVPLPAAARYDRKLCEFILPYTAVRRAEDPEGQVMSFLESTYAAAAGLGRWDRGALERASVQSPTTGEHP